MLLHRYQAIAKAVGLINTQKFCRQDVGAALVVGCLKYVDANDGDLSICNIFLLGSLC
jgi:hypothetical protein